MRAPEAATTSPIRATPRADGLLFCPEEAQPGLPRFPLEAVSEISPRLAQLEALWAEGRVESLDGGCCFLPLEHFYNLAEEERSVLGIPEPDSSIVIELRTEGGARTAEFVIRPVFRHPELGILAGEARLGPFLPYLDRFLALTPEAAILLSILDRPAPTAPAERLVYVGDVKEAAKKANTVLDTFLRNEEIIRPEGISAEMDIDASGVGTLRPTLESGQGPLEVPGFASDPEAQRPFYFKPEGSRRKRVVLDERQRAAVREVRKKPPLAGPDLLTFLDNPEAFLPDTLDLKRYSPRVRGFVPKRYNSHPYVAARRTGKRDWFALDPSIELTPLPEPEGTAPESVDGTPPSRPPPETPSAGPKMDPSDYRAMCQNVLDSNQPYQPFGDGWVFIDPNTARRYLETFQAAELAPDGQWVVDVARHPFVLDVISNLEELEYSERVERQALPEVPNYELPNTLRTTLFEHQAYGYRWLRFLYDRSLGGLLADDMGLGKTVQVLALFSALAEQGELGPSLLVAPVALIQNWEEELRKFAPIVGPTYWHQGPYRLRSSEAVSRHTLVMTTYQTLRSDQLLLGQINWNVVACDEAQYVKNPTAQSTSAVKALKSRLRVAITGTPVENGLSELWCIVDFAQPGKLSSQKEFRDAFERPIRDTSDPGTLVALATELQRRLTPHYVRRLKDDVLSLPPKSQRRVLSHLSGRQEQLYVRIVRQVRAREITPPDAVNRLIRICSHPELEEPTGADSARLLLDAPKLQETVQLLRTISEQGEKVVVFTRYRRMQQILQSVIATELKTHAPIINGLLGGPARVELVHRFNRQPGFGVLLASPEAGGVGLNITGANHVIHYTRLWNPAKENQATDRVHRIGQERPVTVHYPVVTGNKSASVEERLDEVLEEKSELARNVLWPRDRLEVQVEELASVLFQGEI